MNSRLDSVSPELSMEIDDQNDTTLKQLVVEACTFAIKNANLGAERILSEIIDSYGMDVWIWYPNMGLDYSHPDAIENELKEREEIFSQLKRIDVVFVPGGDPGDLHPDHHHRWQ